MREGMLYITVLMMLMASCQKNPPGEILPPPTNSGQHTLGFFVNGEPWVPYDRGSHEIYELPKAKLTNEGHLKISATRIDDNLSCRQWFCIEIKDRCTSVGEYELSSIDCNSPFQTFYYGSNGNKPGIVYQIDESKPHIIEITHLDTQSKIISGTFESDLISEDTNDTLKIRSGRFDLLYK